MQEIENDSSSPISLDVFGDLFSNLDDLIDSQRHFLIDLESTLQKSSEVQRLGRVFLHSV